MAGADGVLGTLRILVDADTAKAQRALKSFGGRAQVAGAAIGAGMGAALGAGLKIGDEYKAATNAIRVGTGDIGADLKMVEDSFKRVAGSVPQDIGTVAQAVADVRTRTGKTGADLDALSVSFLDMSRLLNVDVSTAIDKVTRLYGDWSVAAEDQVKTNDLLLRASQATGMSVDALAESMVQFGAPLRNLGFDLVDSVAMLSKWEKEGVNTTLALGGLKIALGEFAKEGKPAKESTEALFDAIKNATDETWAMAKGVDYFGSRAGPDMVAAIREGRFEFSDFADQLENGDESIAALADETRTFADDFRAMVNQVKVGIGPITDGFAGIADAMGNAIFLLPALGGFLGKQVGKVLSSGAVRGAAAKGGALIGKAVGMAMMGSRGIVGAIRGSAAWGRMGTFAGGKFGKAFGIAAAAAMALIILAEIQELIRIRDANFASAAKVDDDFANWLKGAPTKAEAEAQLAYLRETVKGVDGVKGAIDSIGDLGEGNILGSGLEFLFGSNPSEVVNNQIRQLEAYIASGQADIAKAVSTPIDADPNIDIASAVRRDFQVATAEVGKGFGNIKQALANPPQMISKGDRLDNMAKRMKQIVANIRKATEIGDPMAQKYWEKARAKQQAAIDRLKSKNVATSRDLKKAYRDAGVDIGKSWNKTKTKTAQATRQAKDAAAKNARESKQAQVQQATEASTQTVEQLEKVKTWFQSATLYGDGYGLMTTLASGIAAASPAVIAAVDSILAEVRARTQGQSPPPKGPLSSIDTGGEKVMRAWLGGAESVARQAESVGNRLAGALAPRATMAGVAAAMSPAGVLGGGVTIQVGTLIADEAGLDMLQARLDRRLKRRSRHNDRY